MPVGEGEREPLVDSLRAVALLGIVVVNVAFYRTGVGPSLAAGGGPVGGEVGPLGVVLSALTEGRFYPLFSFLFGWGFAVQDARSRARGRTVTGPWLRRLAALWVLGALHAFLLFDGDILTTYAVIGVGLLLVRSLPAGWLAGLGAALVLGQALLATALDALGSLVVADQGEAAYRADRWRELFDSAAVYRSGGFLDVVGERASDVAWTYPLGFLSVGGTVAGMMLLGMAAARVGWVDERRWPAWLRVSMVPLWLVGLALSVPAAWLLGDTTLGVEDPGAAALSRLLYAGLGPFMALLWAGTLVRAGSVRVLRRGLDAIAPAGRMSLTVYLGQSVVASLLFNGYGLGLGADLGLGGAVTLVAVLWGLQIVLASLWLRWFTMGPLEAVVRAVAYLRWPTLRRSDPPTPLAPEPAPR